MFTVTIGASFISPLDNLILLYSLYKAFPLVRNIDITCFQTKKMKEIKLQTKEKATHVGRVCVKGEQSL